MNPIKPVSTNRQFLSSFFAKETRTEACLWLALAAGGVTAFVVGEPESSKLLMNADENSDGRLDQNETSRLMHSPFIDRDLSRNLSTLEIRLAQVVGEKAMTTVPALARDFMSTLDAIELKNGQLSGK